MKHGPYRISRLAVNGSQAGDDEPRPALPVATGRGSGTGQPGFCLKRFQPVDPDNPSTPLLSKQHMKHTSLILGAAILGALTAPAFAQQAATAQGASMIASAPGTATMANVVKVTASVEAIDKATREVTIKGPRGNLGVITAGPEVRNFDQIKVGDMVVARYVEALTLTLKKDGKELRSRTDSKDSAHAAAGEKPAGAVGHKINVTADVIAVDAKTQTVTLKGPKRVVDLHVQDPGQFKMIKVGDQIEAEYTEAVALSVEPVAAKK